ncbi:hypothetical protein FACS189413_07290 [Bacteroidia bacterium]|nr:hypothetical protein FACS189413_07290 [Bacteroidia bacterium]
MNRLLYILPVISILLLHSCIAEDLTECNFEKASIQLLFTYEDEDTPSLFDASSLNKGTLFVFDANDSLVAQRVIDNVILNKNYRMELDLDTGLYQFVTWFYKPAAPYYYQIPQPNISPAQKMKENSRLYVRVPEGSDRTFTSLPYQLVYGQTQTRDSLSLIGQTAIEIPLILDYNRIDFKISGFDRSNDEYQIFVTDNNRIYTFGNDFAPADDFSYAVTTRFNDDWLEASLNVLKLHAEHINPVLKIKNKSNNIQIYSGNLIPLLRIAYPDPDIFQKKHIFELELSMTEKGIIISVNGWDPGDLDDTVVLSD